MMMYNNEKAYKKSTTRIEPITTVKGVLFSFLFALFSLAVFSISNVYANCSRCDPNLSNIDCSNSNYYGLLSSSNTDNNNNDCFSAPIPGTDGNAGVDTGGECAVFTSAKAQAKEKCDREREEAREQREEAEERVKEIADQQQEALEQRQEVIQDQIEEQRREADRMREEARRAEEQRKQTIENLKNDCRGNHQELLSQRERMEDSVQQIQSEIDKIEDNIVKESVEVSKREDELQQNILKFRQEIRDRIRRLEQTQERELDGLDKEVDALEQQLLQASLDLERAELQRQEACKQRYLQYEQAQEQCFNEARTRVSQERDAYYTTIYTGQRTFQSLSDTPNPQQIDARFTNLLNQRQAQCYDRAIGQEVDIIPCNLKLLRERDQICQGESPPNKCPQTTAGKQIENLLRNQLEGMAIQQKESAAQTRQVLERINEIPADRKQVLERFREDIQNLQTEFNERYQRLTNELERIRDRSFNAIQELEKRKIRLISQNPARHFQENIELAVEACCATPGALATQCRQISTYLIDARRLARLHVQPLLTRDPSKTNSTRMSAGSSGQR